MAEQLDLFSAPPDAASLPDGFRFQRELITVEAEQALLTRIRELPFKEFEFHGYVGKRRTISFGHAYDFTSERLQPAEAMPDFLLELRAVAAAFADVPAERLRQVLVSEYGPEAGIGWHWDESVFDDVLGVSLLSSCRFRLRRRVGETWERVAVEATPRSAYLLRGPARTEWEHSIPPVAIARYSITFRTLAVER